jgi:hypothetical protein
VLIPHCIKFSDRVCTMLVTEHFNRCSASSPAFDLWTFLRLMPCDADCANGIEL